MLSITRSHRADPFGPLDRLFDDLVPRVAAPDGSAQGDFVPPLDVAEDEEGYGVRVEIPGVAPSDVEVRFEDDTLTVRGEKKAPEQAKEQRAYRLERRFGRFVRAVQFASAVDVEQIAATHRDGVLEIRVPKSAKARGRTIAIRTAE